MLIALPELSRTAMVCMRAAIVECEDASQVQTVFQRTSRWSEDLICLVNAGSQLLKGDDEY